MSSRIADDTLSMDYFRRLHLFRRGNLLIIVGAVLSIALAATTLSGRNELAVILPLILIVFTVGTVFSSIVWRCPSCSRPFTRAHRKCYCEHCGIQFSFSPPHTTPK